MVEKRQFEVVQEDTEPAPAGQRNVAQTQAIQAYIMAARAMAARFIIALSNLFTLLTVGSAFVLWWSIPDPNPYQIASLTIYAVFVLAANYIVRKLK
jgi:hypothetical protein